MTFSMKPMVLMLAGSLLLAGCGDETASDPNGPVTEIATEALIGIYPNLDNYDTATGYFDDIVYGDAAAPITIVEYASFTCSHCATFDTLILPEVTKKLLDTGRAKLVFRNYVRDQYDIVAASVARCGDEAAAKRISGLFFERQQDWYAQGVNPVEALAKVARNAGFSRAKFERCAVNTDMSNFLTSMRDLAGTELRLYATPTIYVGGKLIDDYRYETIEAAVIAAEGR